MLELVEEIYDLDTDLLTEINIGAIEKVATFLDLKTVFHRASAFSSSLRSSERLAEIAAHVQATHYLTGHGARAYLDTSRFDDKQLEVEIMEYKRTPYPQLYGEFDPHVSILDLVANTGRQAARFLESNSQPWSYDERNRKVSA
jgi:hypothetical protein